MDIMDKNNRTSEAVVKVEEPKPRPFVLWDVNGETYRLKLTTSKIMELEARFNASLLDAVVDEGLPRISVVIPLLHAALQKMHHGIKVEAVTDLYDEYMDAGKTQIDLMHDVIYPLMADAGFFTQAQVKEIQEALEELTTTP